MTDKNVIVIGAGIAGLSAGVYAAKAGFKTTILESHIIPGGLSTSWKRKGYLFEGGMHWLTGSSEKLTLNQIWKETGALQENNPIFNKDPFYTLIVGNKRLHLYKNIDKLANHLLEYAPEDKKAIKRLRRDVKLFEGVHMPVSDVPGLKAKKHYRPSLIELLKMAPAVLRLAALTKQSYIDYVFKFNNKDVRHLLMTVIGTRYNALSFIYTLASYSSGDCGYPEGGSLRMATNMADTFEKYGGKIQYRTFVEKIEIENNKVVGVKTDKGFIPCDAVIVTQDTRKAIDTLFNPPLTDKWTKTMRKNVISEQNMFVCLGIKADLKEYPRSMVLPLEKPLCCAGLVFDSLRVNNYALYKDHAPEGCTAITCLLIGNSYHYWKQAKEDGTYKDKKNELAQEFIERVTEFIPEMKDNIEVIDVATPLTYERYCNTYEGSWMSVWEPGGKSIDYPIKCKSVDGLYFASQRSMMPGGLPIAVSAGRTAAQLLCKDTNTIFI